MADFPASEEAATATAPALQTAWRRCGELRAAAERAERRAMLLQGGFVSASFLAVLLAVLTAVENPWSGAPGRSAVEIALVVVLILGAALLAFANREGDRDASLLLRSGAAEIESSAFLFATLLQDHEGRETWLLDRVRAIRRRVFERLGRELTPRPGESAARPRDLGGELLAEEYIHRRLESQIARHYGGARRLEATRLRLQIAAFAAVGAGLLLAIPGFSATVLVALAASAALALFAWSGQRRLGAHAGRRREVAFALGQIRDHWRGLAAIEQSGERFMRLVAATEKVLGCLYDDAALTARLAVAELSGGEEDLLERIQKMPASAALDAALGQQEPEEEAPATGEEPPTAFEAPGAADGRRLTEKSPPHAFVVMPFGRKQSPQGDWIDFDQIYGQLIRPALLEAGFEPFRADEESVAGDILTDMFQELLLADLVIADLSIDNANVFYELGVRHAMRKRGVIHIQSGRSYMPFDIFNVRTLPYHCDASGKPDPAHLGKDRQTIAHCARETWASNKDRIHSPIFNLLDGLSEPDRRALRTPLASGYWREHNEWKQRIEVARRRKSVGDLLLLTEEVSNPLIQEKAISQVGLALRTLGLDELALRQYRRGLEINPRNRELRREEAVHLGRLKRYEEAEVKLRRLLQDDPGDIEARFALGEIYENIWREEFEGVEEERQRLEEAYHASDWLKKAIATFVDAYRLDQNHAWSGTKAYVLSKLLHHVVQAQKELGSFSDPEASLIEQELEALRGAVRFTLESRARRGVDSFAALVRLGYMAICEADDPRPVNKAFRKALTMASKNRFYLKFTLERLRLFEELGFRPPFTRAGIDVFDKALADLRTAQAGIERDDEYRPPKVFLFEGLEIDREDQEEDRFPAGMEDEVRDKLAALMDELEAGKRDLGMTASASCGGDILFIEECVKRGMRVRVHLPLDKAQFIEQSVHYAGDSWVERFHDLWNHPDVTFLIQEDRVGPVPEGDDAYERSNRWALYSALGHGIDRLRLVLLWDGKTGDARGGASHMLEQVRSHGGRSVRLDTTEFKYRKKSASARSATPR